MIFWIIGIVVIVFALVALFALTWVFIFKRDIPFIATGWRKHWWEMWQPKLASPGSQRAARMGCVCPVGQNNNGVKEPDKGWLVRPSCELHGDMETRKTGSGAMLTRSDPME